MHTNLTKPLQQYSAATTALPINRIPDQQEFLRISKSLLTKVDPARLQLQTPSKEAQSLDFIRKMKREKLERIARAYRAYALRRCIKRRSAARKIIRWMVRRRREARARIVQKYLRGYRARKQV